MPSLKNTDQQSTETFINELNGFSNSIQTGGKKKSSKKITKKVSKKGSKKVSKKKSKKSSKKVSKKGSKKITKKSSKMSRMNNIEQHGGTYISSNISLGPAKIKPIGSYDSGPNKGKTFDEVLSDKNNTITPPKITAIGSYDSGPNKGKTFSEVSSTKPDVEKKGGYKMYQQEEQFGGKKGTKKVSKKSIIIDN